MGVSATRPKGRRISGAPRAPLVAYGLAYAAFLLMLASVIFQRRDFR
jgi:hypothetical protein